MEKESFIKYVKNPLLLDLDSESELLNLTSKYPYFQSAQILLYLNMLKNNSHQSAKQLSLAAIYCSDRRILKEKSDLILNPVIEKEVEEKPDVIELQLKTHVAEKAVEAIENVESAVVDISPEKPDVFNEIKAEEIIITEIPVKKADTQPVSEISELTDNDIAENIQNSAPAKDEQKPKKIIPKEEIIEKFIKEQPKINTPLADKNFSEKEIDKNSLVESDDFVSETLAMVYENQGYFAKAIKIYEKLSLENPEKSSFFASRIEKLKNISNQQ